MSALASQRESGVVREFAERMRRPTSPPRDAGDALRQQLLNRTAAWLAARGVREIALFGAGRHTRPIVRQPWCAHGVRVAVILDDQPRGSVMSGVALRRAGEALPGEVGAIVISSEHYERSLYDRACALYGATGLPIVRLYGGEGDERYEASRTLEVLSAWPGLNADDARWLVENRGERHDATLPMLPAARTELHLRRYELAGEILSATGGASVADLACGTGYGAGVLRASGARTYVGVDLDARTIEYARRRHGGEGREFVVADATRTPIESASVDLVASFETIEHVADTTGLVAEYARVLKPGGTLVVSTPNKMGPTPYHVHDFDAASFVGALETKFTVERVLGQLPVDDVFDPSLPAGMWRVEQPGAGEILAPDGSGRRADFLIAVARVRDAGTPARSGTSGTKISRTPGADEERVRTRHGEITFFCPNEASRWRAQTLLTKEPETLDWIDRFDAGDVFWDIGANTGPYVMYAAAAGRAGRIVAFDPSPWNWWVLAEQVRRSGLDGLVRAYSIALSDTSAAEPLHMRHTIAAGSGSSIGEPIGEFGERFTPVFCQAAIGISVDDLVARFGVEFPNRIKIDVDGAEERVVAGMTRTLGDARLKSVTIELDDSRADLVGRITRAMEGGGLVLAGKRHAAFVDATPTASIFNFEFTRPRAGT